MWKSVIRPEALHALKSRTRSCSHLPDRALSHAISTENTRPYCYLFRPLQDYHCKNHCRRWWSRHDFLGTFEWFSTDAPISNFIVEVGLVENPQAFPQVVIYCFLWRRSHKVLHKVTFHSFYVFQFSILQIFLCVRLPNWSCHHDEARYWFGSIGCRSSFGALGIYRRQNVRSVVAVSKGHLKIYHWPSRQIGSDRQPLPPNHCMLDCRSLFPFAFRSLSSLLSHFACFRPCLHSFVLSKKNKS